MPPVHRRTIVFVCTGNTCRSPLAAALCEAKLAERLGVAVPDLASAGFVVRSAGVAAYPGDPASDPAVRVAASYGGDLSTHRSQPIHPDLLASATDVIAMTASHAAMLTMYFPQTGPPPQLLCDDGDLPDPFGAPPEVYELCAQVIAYHLDRRLSEWLA
jgi:protein-tyrosine-phosphatase